MNFPLYIAKRYIVSKSKNNAINIISKIAMGGIIVGAMALFVVLSVFSGLRVFSLSFSNDFDPDLKVSPIYGKSFFVSVEQEKKLQKIASINSYSKIVEERVLFSFDGKQLISTLKGVDKNYTKINKVTDSLFEGQWLKPKTFQAVVGYGISEKLSMGLFDFNNAFEVKAPKPGVGDLALTLEDAFNRSDLIPVGVFATKNEELDSKYVFSDLGLAQDVLQYKTNQVSGIEIILKQNTSENKVIEQLKTVFNNTITVKTRAELNATLHKMLNTENVVVYLIFTLVIIIALFNLIGALIMMIIDKKANLKTLYSLGVEVKDLRKMFMFQGSLLSIIGGGIGLILGILIIIIQQQFELIMITPSLSYPVKFSFLNVLIVFVTIVSLGIIASYIASSRVSKKLLN